MTTGVTGALVPGLEGEARMTVTPDKTATRVGSGSADVLATPMLIAVMEAAAVDCVEHLLATGTATLGTRIEADHIAATPPGALVTARARLTAVDGRKLTFSIEAHDDHELIGRATHTRVVVDTSRFTAKLAEKAKNPM